MLQVVHNELSMHKAANCQKIFSGQFSFFVIRTGSGDILGSRTMEKIASSKPKVGRAWLDFGLL